MKSLILIIFAITIWTTSIAQAQTSKDSISIFYDSLFAKLKKKYLFSKEVKWNTLKPYIKQKALQNENLEESLKTCTILFDSIKGNHCQVFSEKGWYGSTLNKNFTQDDFSPSFLKKYEENQENPVFDVRVLDNNYGYIFIPGMLLLNASQDSLNSKSQHMYDEIIKMSNTKSLKGWIIDLRFNIGGNVYPMLTSLYHFIGDNTVYNQLDEHMNISVAHTLKKGIFYSGDKIETRIKPSHKPDIEVPITLIVGKMTTSAGEDVVLGFRGRKNVKIIGEESYGFLTGNDMVELPFGIKMAFTTGYLADRTGRYTPCVIPDILIEKQDNFEDLLKDKNIIQSIEFIDVSQ